MDLANEIGSKTAGVYLATNQLKTLAELIYCPGADDSIEWDADKANGFSNLLEGIAHEIDTQVDEIGDLTARSK